MRRILLSLLSSCAASACIQAWQSGCTAATPCCDGCHCSNGVCKPLDPGAGSCIAPGPPSPAPAPSPPPAPLPPTPRVLPSGPIIAGYATRCSSAATGDGDANVLQAARSGVNVVIWFASNLATTGGPDARPRVETGLDFDCIARTALTLRREQLQTTHMISIGGWDAPHPNTTWTGADWWNAWAAWNAAVVARPALGFAGFDGIDWDLEGNDKIDSPWNTFSVACMELVGTMSQHAKAAGYLVSLVPPESYLDVTTAAYDLSLTHTYPDGWQPAFTYHGHNVYALFLAQYGNSTSAATGGTVPTFDFVDVQLYESWAHADYQTTQRGVDPADYLVEWATAVQKGWVVEFAGAAPHGTPTQLVRVPAQQLVVGFSRGMGNGKSVFFWPRDIGRAFERLDASGMRPRGVMFWNIEAEGGGVNGTSTACALAPAFNDFMNVRNVSSGGGACSPL